MGAESIDVGDRLLRSRNDLKRDGEVAVLSRPLVVFDGVSKREYRSGRGASSDGYHHGF